MLWCLVKKTVASDDENSMLAAAVLDDSEIPDTLPAGLCRALWLQEDIQENN